MSVRREDGGKEREKYTYYDSCRTWSSLTPIRARSFDFFKNLSSPVTCVWNFYRNGSEDPNTRNNFISEGINLPFKFRMQLNK